MPCGEIGGNEKAARGEGLCAAQSLLERALLSAPAMLSHSLNPDPVAIRQELALQDPADIRSSAFLRFVIRLSERLDRDIPREDYAQLATLGGCHDYIRRTR